MPKTYGDNKHLDCTESANGKLNLVFVVLNISEDVSCQANILDAMADPKLANLDANATDLA